MSAAILLELLESKGVALSVQDGKLRVKAPPGTITPSLKQTIAEEKPRLIELLQSSASERVPQSPKSAVDAEELHYAYEERQAIKEHEAGLAKEEAREQARNEILGHFKFPNGNSIEITNKDELGPWVQVFELLAKWDEEARMKDAVVDKLELDSGSEE